MKVRELLSGPEKWGKGSEIYYNRRCLWLAIDDCYPVDCERVFARVVREIKQDSIILWNDAPERTFREVKALVEKLDI